MPTPDATPQPKQVTVILFRNNKNDEWQFHWGGPFGNREEAIIWWESIAAVGSWSDLHRRDLVKCVRATLAVEETT